MATIVARVQPDGSLVKVMPDGSTTPMHGKSDWAALDAMTDAEITAAALADPDAQPLTDKQLAKMRRGPHPRFLRRRLRLSREDFAARYHFALDQLLSWETHKSHPDETIRAYLMAIAADPEGVARAVAAPSAVAAV